MSKDKDKKKKKDKKKSKASESPGISRATKSLKAIADNPLVTEVVAAALVGAAAALKDSDKARKLAAKAGDHLGDMAKGSADRGNAMWALALDVGRKTLEALAEEAATNRKAK
ncbi:hypothetical protein GCM10022276_10080 [Sphingomonas limnosediminicola]|uniref:Uncharacterized protein n=1 Tax=Sphingomonas limnosediminicola TaxID=940133 RepID=A0ABP7L2I3_9SPHN